MNRTLTDVQLTEAVARNFHDEKLPHIITYTDTPLDTFKFPKSQCSGAWRQAIDAAKRTIAEKPKSLSKKFDFHPTVWYNFMQ